MKSKLQKIWKHRSDLRYIFSSIYFCFHYLPFKQAVKLPILVYKPHFGSLRGKVCFADGSKIRYGMVRLGFPNVSIYPNTGIIYENLGGTITFKGTCFIGNNSAISIAKGAQISFGNLFRASTTLKIVNYYSINIDKEVLIGWDCVIMDTDIHKLTKRSGGYSKGYDAINIGSNCWIANGCKILKRTEIPNNCVVAAGTILSGKVEAPEFSIVGSGRNVDVLSTGIYWNIQDDKVIYNYN